MFTQISSTPSSNLPKFVGPTDSLPMALSSAVPGDMIVVDPANDTLITGKFLLPNGDCANQKWITIKSASPLLPDEYTAVTPSFAGNLPKISLNAQNATITGGSCVRLIGFEIRRKAGGIVYDLISGLGHDVILDRLYVHGTHTDETVRGVSLANSYNVAVINSYFSDFHCLSPGTCVDSQAIQGGTSSVPDGNYKIANNYLEAAGENILFGGGAAYGPPPDIGIFYNTIAKNPCWNPSEPCYVGTKFVVKNLLELKNATRVLIEGNTLAYSWGGFTQVGEIVAVTPKNQSAANGANVCPLCAVTEVTLRYNHASFGAQALQLACIPSPNGGWPAACGDWSIHDNLFDHLQYPTCYQCTQFTNEIANGNGGTVLSGVNVSHNTFLNDGWLKVSPTATAALLLAAPPTGIQGIRFDSNAFDPGNNGIYSTGGGVNNCFSSGTSIAPLIAKCWPSGSMTGNQFFTTLPLTKARLPWPDGNDVPSAGADQNAINAAVGKKH